MNKRKLLGLLCLMTLLATSCDNKGDYWGAMESSKGGFYQFHFLFLA